MVDQAAERTVGAARAPLGLAPGHGGRVQEVLALSRRWYIMLIRERLNLAFSVAQPAIWLVFFGLAVGRAIDRDVIGTSDYLGFVLPGIIAFTVIGDAVSGAMPLMWDKEMGYLDKLMTMPIARSSVIVSRFVFQHALGTAQVLGLFVVAAIIGVRVSAGIGGVLVILVAAGFLGMAVTAAFSALAFWVPGHGTFFAITGFISMPVLFLSNAFVPLDAMPGWMAAFARVNPLTYAIGAMRTLVLDGWTVGVAGNLAVLAAFAGACLAAGTWQFNRLTGGRVR